MLELEAASLLRAAFDESLFKDKSLFKMSSQTRNAERLEEDIAPR